MTINYEEYVHEWLAGYNALKGEAALKCPFSPKTDEATAWHAGLAKARRDAKDPHADWCDDPDDPDWYPTDVEDADHEVAKCLNPTSKPPPAAADPVKPPVDIHELIARFIEPRKASTGKKWQIYCRICRQDICEDQSWAPRTGIRSFERYNKYVAPLEEQHIAEHLKAGEVPK